MNITTANAVLESAHECDEAVGKEGLGEVVCKQERVHKRYVCHVYY